MSDDFLYGAGTSAHQVEGNNVHNDWWEWEKGRKSIENSGRAADHYQMFDDDFVMARQLGHNAHRMSLEWSRIEPKMGQWDQAAIAHYRKVLESLRANGLTSFVGLHHFTNPMWLSLQGGWNWRRTPELFARYAKKIAQELGNLVDFWITINEPVVYATQAYWAGRWPPQERNGLAVYRVLSMMARGHRLAYRALHSVDSSAKVGMAKHMIAFVPDREVWSDHLVSKFGNWWFNHRWYQLTASRHDFIGLNFYFTKTQAAHIIPPRVETIEWSGAVSDLGWPVNPEGLAQVLNEVKRYDLPIYITENGLADASDNHRADFIRAHLRVVEKAQATGLDVRGYLHWSLIDNFEWDLGFEPRFGLVAVDYNSMKRTPRKSAYVYRAIIKQAS